MLLARAQAVDEYLGASLDERVVGTLRLFRDWGHAPTLTQLSDFLLGGRVDVSLLRSRVADLDGVVSEDGIIGLVGWENLIEKTRRRLRSNLALNGTFVGVAESFVKDLVASCPFIRSVALAGSLATGGFDQGDDIDFDLFVDTGTRYTAYLLATMIGLRYAWRYRHRRPSELHRTPFLPKITCVNVVWSEDQIRPFWRQDDSLAFELMRCQPLYGVDFFTDVLASNRWISAHFPQLFERVSEERIAAGQNLFGRFLEAIGRYRWFLRGLETLSRGISWVIYSFVQRGRGRNPRAVARIEFLRRVKYPYEVFQD